MSNLSNEEENVEESRRRVRGEGEGEVGIGDGEGGLYPRPLTYSSVVDHGRHTASPSQGIDAVDDATPPSRAPLCLAHLRRRAKLPVFLSQGDHTRASMSSSEASGRKLGIAGSWDVVVFFSAACDMRRRCQDYPWKRVSLLVFIFAMGAVAVLTCETCTHTGENTWAAVRGVQTARGRIAARGF